MKQRATEAPTSPPNRRRGGCAYAQNLNVVPIANSFPDMSEVMFVPGTAPAGLYQALDWEWEKPWVYERSSVMPFARTTEVPRERWCAMKSGEPTL
jgi:hypothetical protein